LKFENQYIIQFKGLREGVHAFEFLLEKPFFEEFEHLEVPYGKVEVAIDLDKKTSFLDLQIRLNGMISVQCDRCLGYFELPVENDSHLVVRFSETEKEGDDEIIFLHPEDHRLDLKHYFYECLVLAIPYRKVHPGKADGSEGCDEEMMGKLNELLIGE
jgi:uncharacterized metal-binding protein YceD (DUF177 family)